MNSCLVLAWPEETTGCPSCFGGAAAAFTSSPNEGNPREPVHIHVSRAGATAKFWLFPDVELAYNRGFDARMLKRVQDVVEQRRSELEEMWNEYFA